MMTWLSRAPSLRTLRSAPVAMALACGAAALLGACGSDSSSDATGASGTGGSAAGTGGSAGSSGGSAGSGASGGTRSGSPTPIGEYCQTAAAARFDWLRMCYGEGAYAEEDRADYVDGLEGRCLNAEAAIDAGRLAYDEYQATECVATIDTDECTAGFLGDACEGVFEGRVAMGQDCYVEESLVFLVGVEGCAEGYCEQGDACPGTCVPFAERGESCTDTNCGPEDYCDGICMARKAEGQACESGHCLDGLVCREGTCVELASGPDDVCSDSRPCSGVAVCVDGTCRARVELGDPCQLDLHCPEGALCSTLPATEDPTCIEPLGDGSACNANAQCADGLVCVMSAGATEGTCGQDPNVGGEAEPCGSNGCADGLWCQVDEVNVDGICRAPVGEGGDCVTSGLPLGTCADGLYCAEAGTCEPAGGESEPCNISSTGSCLEGLWCSRATGLCAPPASQGASCNPLWPEACAEGLGCDCGLEDRDSCGGTGREPSPTDTCQPLQSAGDACYRTAECAEGDCTFDFDAPTTTPGRCIAPEPPCLP